ncbi:transposable element Tcb2 transposase [Trichonephila clavipes]|nr:transposable element Tcb2 transposase [Trichonephila clavipes]
MGKLPDLDAFDRREIIGARRMGHSISKIVRQLGFSRSTVSLYQEYMDGGQKKTSHQANCKGQLALTVHDKRDGSGVLYVASKAKLLLLIARHQAFCLAWAKEHRDWSVENWKRVTWSDESSFQLLNADRRLKIWGQAHEAMDPACQVGTVQGHGGSLMDVFSWHCLGSLVYVLSSLNAIWYVELLHDHLHLFILYCYPHSNEVFQQDNCTSHKPWLEEHSFDFSAINWLPRNPNLNPIEHLWDVLEQGVKGRHTASMNLIELCTALANIWQVISMERFQKLVESMPHRVAAVIKARGGPTRY